MSKPVSDYTHDGFAVKPFIYKDLNMSIQPLESQRFIRKTQLAPNEYRKNFQQIDREILSAITSAEADQVTPLMSKIYLRLVNAPEKYWEREGVLRIEAEVRDEKLVKSWSVLCELVGVASATASKALRWMHEQGIIGYFSGKNGVGLRIFLNRAVSSIGVRAVSGGKKFLAIPPTSSGEVHGSLNEPAFNDSYADLEVSDTDLNPHAPKNGAVNTEVVNKHSNPETFLTSHPQLSTARSPEESDAATVGVSSGVVSVDEIVMRLQSVLEPALTTVAVETARREHERTREWLDKHGIPKATRVAQREAYNVLRSHGVIAAAAESRRHTDLQVGGVSEVYTPQEAHPLSEREITETAETCFALLEAQGKAIDVTLSEISSEAGGWILPEDAPRVREATQALLFIRNEKR